LIQDAINNASSLVPQECIIYNEVAMVHVNNEIEETKQLDLNPKTQT
jgi:hypothetical protein